MAFTDSNTASCTNAAHRAWANGFWPFVIAVLRHARPKDRLASRARKNMKTNHAGIKIAIVRFGFHPRTSLLK